MIKIELYIDDFDSRLLNGWAYAPLSLKDKITVEVLDGNSRILRKAVANVFRQDLFDSNIGDGTYGFSMVGDFVDAAEIRLSIPFTLAGPDKIVMEKHRIHPNDPIFKHLFQSFKRDMDTAIGYFLEDGEESARKLKMLCSTFTSWKVEKRLSLLEFASGYGNVTRNLDRMTFDVTSYDFRPEASEFVKNNFNVNTLSSEFSPDKFYMDEKYDVVFALSFFGHTPNEIFGKWLKALFNSTVTNGCLIFTTHGLESNRKFFHLNISQDGFAFERSDRHNDFWGPDYGLAVTTREFVEKECEKHLGVCPTFFGESFWWEHQDVYVIQK